MEEELKKYYNPFTNIKLTDEQKNAFIEDKLVYPVRFNTLRQNIIGELYLISFMCIGDRKYIKIRGHAPNKDKAIELAKNIADSDTYFYIVIGECETWYEVVPQNEIKSRETISLVDQSVILDNEEKIKEQIDKEKQEIQKRVEQLKVKSKFVSEQVSPLDLLIHNRVKIYDTKRQLEYIQKKFEIMEKRLRCLAGIVNHYEERIDSKEDWYEYYKSKLLETGTTALDKENYTTNELPMEGDLDSLITLLYDIEVEYDGTRPT